MKNHLLLTFCLLLHISYHFLFLYLLSDSLHTLHYLVTTEAAFFPAIMLVVLRRNATLYFQFLSWILCLSDSLSCMIWSSHATRNCWEADRCLMIHTFGNYNPLLSLLGNYFSASLCRFNFPATSGNQLAGTQGKKSKNSLDMLNNTCIHVFFRLQR